MVMQERLGILYFILPTKTYETERRTILDCFETVFSTTRKTNFCFRSNIDRETIGILSELLGRKNAN